MSKISAIRVLAVDDEIDHADVLAEAVARMGYSVKQAHSLADARRYFGAEEFDLVITDLKMDGATDGFALLETVKRARPQSEVIVVTAHGDVSTAVQAMQQGAFNFIQKPLDLEVIRVVVRRAAEKILLQKKTDDLSRALDNKFGISGIIGNSAPMQRVLQLIRQFGPTDISALVLGENGTGKELVARALHQNSRRANERFVALNCAGLSETLLEDELFGHIPGAYTDARGQREGKFEYADGGTLFLDEIGDMPMPMQAKLLRVLQDRQITRVGANEPIQVDVRFITATNKDLMQEIGEKRFREDLYYRIKGTTIRLPPLRERRDDIPLLIDHVIKRSGERLGKVIEGIEPAARNALVAYDWPGNVRQLENTVENMIVLATGPRLSVNDVPPEVMGEQAGTAMIHVPQAQQTTALANVAGMNLAELEKQAILKTLEMVAGNREQAAKILGIGERTLYRKIKEYGLE